MSRLSTYTPALRRVRLLVLDVDGVLTAVGMQYDLKAGKLSLESDVHGEFSPQ